MVFAARVMEGMGEISPRRFSQLLQERPWTDTRWHLYRKECVTCNKISHI